MATCANSRKQWQEARHTTSFTYDEENRPTVLTYENGQAVTYTYDALGRIQKRKVGAERSEVETTYTYVPGANGATTPLIQTISQNGVTLTYTYDSNGNNDGNHL